MAELTLASQLTQGAQTVVSDATVTIVSGRQVDWGSVGTNLPAISAGDYFEVRGHPNTENNGLWKEDGGAPSTGTIRATKVATIGPDPSGDATGRSVTFLGNTTTPKNYFLDTLGQRFCLLKQNGLSDDGAGGKAVYGALMRDTKEDTFLELNTGMPMLAIDNDAGKYIWGQDAAGNFNGYRPFDVTSPAINTTKLIRNSGWVEFDDLGNLTRVRAGFLTLGAFDDPALDTAVIAFGDPRQQSVNSTIAADFTGPVNETFVCYERLADGEVNGGTGIAISADGRTLTRGDSTDWDTEGVEADFVVGGAIGIRDAENSTSNTGTGERLRITAISTTALTCGTPASATVTEGFDFVDGGGGNDSITRNDGGDWLQEGYFVGGAVVVSSATTGANDGTYTILDVTASTIEVATASFTADTDDNTVVFGPFDPTNSPDTTMNVAIDNRNAVELFLRERQAANGSTFAQANLDSINEQVLDGRKFTFVLGSSADAKISESDANIAISAPYTGILVEYYATAQSLGAPGANELDGGARDFGIVITANNGTSQQVYEKVQYLLRQNADIDNGGGTVIGVMADGLCRFVGDNFRVGEFLDTGSPRFPINPLGGGSGVFVSGLNAASRNSTIVIDNLGIERSFPVGTPLTIDFNAFLEGDPGPARFACIFEYAGPGASGGRHTISDLIVTAGTGPVGTIDSALAELPASMDVDPNGYIRIAGYTGVDEPMNGVYQVTATTSTSQWAVIRVDGADIVTTTTGSNLTVDEHPYETPDAIIVQDNTPADISGSAASDYSGTIDYSGNTQGGRTGGQDMSVVVRAQGTTDAQYTLTTPQVIGSGTPVTITVLASEERNV